MYTTCVSQESVEEIGGRSACIRQLRERIKKLAKFDVSVLLLGESGTGKELVARKIHSLSNRRNGPFVGVNCAAIHESLLESELFGHESGAFTGAGSSTIGFFRAAQGGTILLDEVGDMSPQLQSKLLRVLEERAVVPVGSTKAVPIDIRVISATHHDLQAVVSEGRFRQDLYYRLNVITLKIAALRDRPEDIIPLTEHIICKVADLLGMSQKQLTPEAAELMQRYDWPGNVRQLGNVIQQAYVLGDSEQIDTASLPPELHESPGTNGKEFPSLDETVNQHLADALGLAGGVRSRAARLLGVDRKTISRMMQRYGLT
ncbi:MAG TPA: sigma-54-dependent Fis family transcriptional regulator [Phycisphaerae bacterium]|nr:sigma-54-dependent Fis family transcriptional regulator [Phycisphaerae bacterium]